MSQQPHQPGARQQVPGAQQQGPPGGAHGYGQQPGDPGRGGGGFGQGVGAVPQWTGGQGAGGRPPAVAGPGQQGYGGQPAGGVPFEEALPDELRTALADFEQVASVASWCADRCVEEGPEMAHVAGELADVADLAELNARLIARDSRFGPQLAESFRQVATASLDALQPYADRPHVAEAAGVLQRAVDDVGTMLSSLGQQSSGTAARSTASERAESPGRRRGSRRSRRRR